MDLRVRKTRKSIADAFIQLRAKKPLEKITIKELSDLAMINKATFYLHFKDIYDLSDCLENELIQSVLNNITDLDYLISDPYQGTKEFFRGFGSQKEPLYILFSGNRMGIFANKIEKEIKQFIFNKYPEYRNNPKIDILLSLLIQGSFHAHNNNQRYDETILVNTLAEISKYIFEKYK